MAFDSAGLAIDRGVNNSITNPVSPAIHRYVSTTDTLATILASAYFNNALPTSSGYTLTNQAGTLEIGDLMYVVATDNNALIEVTAISPNVTTSYFSTDAPYAIVYAGAQSNGGGSATIAITVTGVLAADLAFAAIESSTNAVSIQKVTTTSNTVTVLLSGDPGAGTVINYQVIRAT